MLRKSTEEKTTWRITCFFKINYTYGGNRGEEKNNNRII